MSSYNAEADRVSFKEAWAHERRTQNHVHNIEEKIDGYHGRYTDRRGNICAVRGTYALGVPLSWHDAHGNYMVICGSDQGRLVGAK